MATAAPGQPAVVVTTQGFGDNEIDGKTIQLTPFGSDKNKLTVSKIPVQVAEFRCGPGDTNPVPARYLPGSCK